MKNSSEADGWPQFTHDEGELHPDNARIKKDIASTYGEQQLWKSWITTCDKLNELTKVIRDQQTAKIPEIQYDEVFSLSDEKREHLKAVGCFVIRGTIPTETAKEWFTNVQSYVEENKDKITGECSPSQDPITADCCSDQAGLKRPLIS